MARWLACAWLLAGVAGQVAHAHEVRPAYLEIIATGGDTYAVTFKQPILGDRRLPITPTLPDGCEATGDVTAITEPGSHTERWTVRCPDGLVGTSIGIDGLSRTMIDALVRVELADGDVRTLLLKPGQPEVELAAEPQAQVLDYLMLGIEHLLFGFDHVLFVLGLMYFVSGFGALVRTVTSFTVAHSITLALSTLGLVTVSSRPVEATIALSILFLAAEALRNEHRSVVWQRPWVIAFGFGLLHGFGFAGALADLGLPRDAVAWALLLFNVGVEIGQLILILGMLVVVAMYSRLPARPHWVPTVPLLFMGVMAAWWSVERSVPILLG